MIYENTIKAFKLALVLTVSYFISMGIVELITYQIQAESLITSELLDNLYLVLNSLFFILTILLIKLFMDENQVKEFT